MSAEQLARGEIERLERIVADDAAAPVFPALAEAHRQRGDPKRAEEVARAGLAARPDHVAGGVTLALALIDQGRSREARTVLEQTLQSAPEHALARRALEELGVPRASSPLLEGLDSELEAAFETARPDAEAMVDANDLAREAVRRVDYEATELVTAEGSPFATRTVANLLEQQGDLDNAEAVRRGLQEGTKPSDTDRRQRVLTTLEGWLLKLRQRRAR